MNRPENGIPSSIFNNPLSFRESSFHMTKWGGGGEEEDIEGGASKIFRHPKGGL